MPTKTDKVTYKALRNLAISKRLKLMRKPKVGPVLIELLTPTQISELFPSYYRKQLPDIGGFLKAIPTSITRARQEALEKKLFGTSSLTKEREGREFVERLRVEKRREAERPQLTPEQQAAWEKIQRGSITADSPEAKVFSTIPAEQLAALGIEKFKDDKGIEMLRYVAPLITREQAIENLKTTGGDGSTIGQRLAFYREYAKSKGVDPDLVTGIAMQEGARTKDRMQNWSNPDPGRDGIGTAYGDFQLNVGSSRNPRMGNEFLRTGIPMDAAHWREQGKFAIDKMAAGRVGEWMSVDNNGGREAITNIGAREWAKHASNAVPIKPLGPNNTYTDDQISNMQQQLVIEKNAQRRQQLTNIIGRVPGAGPVDITGTGSYIGNIQTSRNTVGHFGESAQCVALSKHFAPNVGAASSWKFKDGMDGMVPGAVIATTSYKDGSGGRMAKDMPDGRSHYHTGVLLTYPDAEGNALIYDQAVSHGARITKVNVNDYNGEQMRAVVGGEPTEKSREAISLALQQANESERSAITNSASGKPVDIQNTPATKIEQNTEKLGSAPAQSKTILEIANHKRDEAPPGPSNPHAKGGMYSATHPASPTLEAIANHKRTEAPPGPSNPNAKGGMFTAPTPSEKGGIPQQKNTLTPQIDEPKGKKATEPPKPQGALAPPKVEGKVEVMPTQKVPDNLSVPPPQMPNNNLSMGDFHSALGEMKNDLESKINELAKNPKRLAEPNDREADLMSSLLQKTADAFIDPTSFRAFSRTRFSETGDAVSDYHNSYGNKNIR